MKVDHILSRKHGGGSSADNLAYACTICNRLKGSDIASIDRSGRLVRLFNPRSADWTQHFGLDGAVIQPLTTAAEATARLLRFNAAERVTERHLLQQFGALSARVIVPLRVSLPSQTCEGKGDRNGILSVSAVFTTLSGFKTFSGTKIGPVLSPLARAAKPPALP